jgi:hypothetical protein
MGKNKKIKHTILELVVLSFVVGLIPELLVGGLTDIWGVCGFDALTCNNTQLQGAIKLVASFLCSVVAVVVALVLSKEYNSDDNDSGNKSASSEDERS